MRPKMQITLFIIAIGLISGSVARAKSWEKYSHTGLGGSYDVIVIDQTAGESRFALEVLENASVHFGFSLDEGTCGILIDVPVGVANGNHSYGGVCEVGIGDVRLEVMLCDDIMIGRPTLKMSDKKTLQDLSRFVIDNCYGG